MAGSQAKHDWLCSKLYKSPEILGIEGVKAKGLEVEMRRNGSTYVVPDIYFRNGVDHYCEVKSSNHPKLYNKGMYQLEKILTWHHEHGFDEPSVKLIMPKSDWQYDNWRDVLEDLQIYTL